VILGVLAMLRENAILLIPFLLVLAFRPGEGLRGFVRTALAFVAGVALAMSPVAVHNGLAGGSWLPTGSSGGLNFYLGNNEKADGTWRPLVPGKQIPALERTEPQRIAEQESGRKLNPGEVSSFWLHKSLRWAKAHPGDFVRLQFRKLGHYFDWYEQPDAVDYYWVRSRSPVYRLPLVEFSTVTLLAVAGLWWSRRNLRRFAPCLLFAAGWIVSTVVFFPFARYRLPLVPAILPLCALPIAATWDAWRAHRPRRLAGAASLAAAFSCSLIPFAPKMDLVHYNLARLAEERGDAAVASVEYQAAYDADPTNFLACLNLGNVAVRRGDWPTALKLFREARALEPESDDVEANLGGALLAVGSLDEAAVHFEAALRLNPQNRGALHNDALLLIRQGDFAGARALVDRMLALDPNDAGAIQLEKRLDGR
jgi:tetratricopeptide (TPR) repeat protein